MGDNIKGIKNISKNVGPKYILRLFITGSTPNSLKAISNTKEICETYLKDNYELEIIDVYQEPAMAETEQIIALPLLVKMAPLPVRKLVGDMSDRKKMLHGLGIEIN